MKHSYYILIFHFFNTFERNTKAAQYLTLIAPTHSSRATAPAVVRQHPLDNPHRTGVANTIILDPVVILIDFLSLVMYYDYFLAGVCGCCHNIVIFVFIFFILIYCEEIFEAYLILETFGVPSIYIIITALLVFRED